MDGISGFFAQPFKPEGSVIDWFLFFGLLIAISVVWGIILRHVLADS